MRFLKILPPFTLIWARMLEEIAKPGPTVTIKLIYWIGSSEGFPEGTDKWLNKTEEMAVGFEDGMLFGLELALSPSISRKAILYS